MSSLSGGVWIVFTLVTFFVSFVCLSQINICHKRSKYFEIEKNERLGSFFPVEDITEIIVDNNYGKHKLSMKELTILKQQLKMATFAGGLLIKPSHIIVHLNLNTKSVARPGFVYASNGAIHFDGGTNIQGKKFCGTYYLPLLLNFDNYK